MFQLPPFDKLSAEFHFSLGPAQYTFSMQGFNSPLSDSLLVIMYK